MCCGSSIQVVDVLSWFRLDSTRIPSFHLDAKVCTSSKKNFNVYHWQNFDGVKIKYNYMPSKLILVHMKNVCYEHQAH